MPHYQRKGRKGAVYTALTEEEENPFGGGPDPQRLESHYRSETVGKWSLTAPGESSTLEDGGLVAMGASVSFAICKFTEFENVYE